MELSHLGLAESCQHNILAFNFPSHMCMQYVFFNPQLKHRKVNT